MTPITRPHLFPVHADPLTWMCLGWNDTAATLRTIFASNRPRNTPVQKFFDHLEQVLRPHQPGSRYGNGIGSLCENTWYQAGIEEAVLYGEQNLVALMNRNYLFPRGEEYTNPMVFHPPLGSDQCDYCGASFTLGWYCDLLVLMNEVLCSLDCCTALTRKRRQENPWLDHFYPILNGHGTRRPDCSIPQDYEAMVEFLVSVPVKDGTDCSSQPPPVPEIVFVPAKVSTGKLEVLV